MSQKKSISLYFMASIAVAIFFLFSSYTGEKKSDTTISSVDTSSAKLPQVVKSIALDKEFSFAGEVVPTENFDVFERLDRELLRDAYWHSSTVLSIKRAKRFFPVIEKILKQEGIPEDMKYLAVAESSLSNAVSPAGAKGVWQFMKGTGKEYGLEINNDVDERYHLEKSTFAACKYLKSLYNKFGNWTMVAAAYNMGGNGLASESKTQRTNNYYELNLNQETSRYIFRILSIKEIMSQPEVYGFYIEDKDKYAPLDKYEEVEISEPVNNWGDFAKKYNTTYRMIKVYNPWLVSDALLNKTKTKYTIRIPKK
jgi:peptidoglycan lytic transglycosylase D